MTVLRFQAARAAPCLVEVNAIRRTALQATVTAHRVVKVDASAAVHTISKAHVMALAEADSWLAQGQNLLAFGPPGVGKIDLIAAIGHALIDRVY